MGFLSFLFAPPEPTGPAPRMPLRRFSPMTDIPPDDYTVIDTETTGLDACTCELLELAAIRYKNHEKVSQFHTFVRPEGAIPPSASKINHITWRKVYDAPPLSKITDAFWDFIGNDTLIGYNISFDIKFLQTRTALNINNTSFDVLPFVKKIYTDFPRYRLDDLRQYFALPGTAHSSLGDCITTAHLYQKALFSPKGAELVHLMKIQESESHIDLKSFEATHTKLGVSTISSVLNKYPKDSAMWLDPNNAGYEYWIQGEYARKSEDIEQAFMLFDKAKKAGFRFPAIYESYALLYRKLKDYESEISILEDALKIFSGPVVERLDYRRNRAKTLLLAKQQKEDALRQKEAERAEKAEARKSKIEQRKSTPKQTICHSVIQCSDDGTVINRYSAVASAAREVGVSSKCIRDAASGRQKHAGGFCWKYSTSTEI